MAESMRDSLSRYFDQIHQMAIEDEQRRRAKSGIPMPAPGRPPLNTAYEGYGPPAPVSPGQQLQARALLNQNEVFPWTSSGFEGPMGEKLPGGDIGHFRLDTPITNPIPPPPTAMSFPNTPSPLDLLQQQGPAYPAGKNKPKKKK